MWPSDVEILICVLTHQIVAVSTKCAAKGKLEGLLFSNFVANVSIIQLSYANNVIF